MTKQKTPKPPAKHKTKYTIYGTGETGEETPLCIVNSPGLTTLIMQFLAQYYTGVRAE